MQAHHLLYVFPSGNFTSGHDHDSAKDTTRVPPAGTVVAAATAAPMDDPGIDTLGSLPVLASLKEPCCVKQMCNGHNITYSENTGTSCKQTG